MLSTFVGTYALAAAVGLGRLSGITASASDEQTPNLAPISFREFMISGLPVLGAGMATGLSQFADRILVSFAVPVATFAYYGFASSAMALAGVARQTLSRVALTHAARRDGEARAHFLDGMYDVIAACYGVALVGEPLFEYVVSRVLPRYVESLAIVRALIPGALFWVATTVVVLGTLQTYGNVRRQFAVSVVGAALSAAGAGGALFAGAPLWGVAAAGSAGSMVSWLVGVVLMHRVVPDAKLANAWRFLAISTVQSLGLAVALAAVSSPLLRIAVCALIAAIPTAVAARRARDLWTT
jgi:O-antigen/teichoic acid export membrane protein